MLGAVSGPPWVCETCQRCCWWRSHTPGIVCTLWLNSDGLLQPRSPSSGKVWFANPPVLCSPQDCLLPSGFRAPSVQSRSDHELRAAPRLRTLILPPRTPRRIWSPRNRVCGTRVPGHERDVWAEMRMLWQKGFLSWAQVDALLSTKQSALLEKGRRGWRAGMCSSLPPTMPQEKQGVRPQLRKRISPIPGHLPDNLVSGHTGRLSPGARSYVSHS